MLCAKALKAVKAAFVLMVGIVGLNAYAEIKHTPVVYASETVDASAKGSTGLMQEAATSTEFDVTGTLKAALPAGRYYFRIDLASSADSGAFTLGRTLTAGGLAQDFHLLPPTGTESLTSTDSATLVYGGAAGSSEAVFEVNTGSRIDLDSRVILGLNRGGDTAANMYGLRIRGGTGAAAASNSYTLTIRVYDDYSEAIRATATTFGQDILSMSTTLAMTKKALTVTVKDPKTITADVAEGFTMFTPQTGGENGVLATVSVMTATDADHDGKDSTPKLPILNATTGEAVKQSEILKASSVDFAGNFSVGTPHVGGTGGTLLDANGKAIAMTGEGGKSYSDADKAAAAMVRIAAKNGTFALNVKGNTMRIPTGSYTASVMVTLMSEMADASQHQVAGPLPAGMIDRNGTSARIGYVTTSPVYNQRLVLTNHGNLDADYTLHNLVVEDGNTGMFMMGDNAPAGLTVSDDGMMAMGMVMKGQQVVLRLGDIVSITGDGPPRGAMQVDMSTRPEDASIATTQVNLRNNDGSADTVSYHP